MPRTLVIATAFLAACATQQGFEKLAARYLGLSETQLVEGLGTPSNTYTTTDAMFLSWERSTVLNPTYQSTIIGGSVYTTPIGGGAVRCMITYKLEPKEVIDLTSEKEETAIDFISTSYRYEGNGCRA